MDGSQPNLVRILLIVWPDCGASFAQIGPRIAELGKFDQVNPPTLNAPYVPNEKPSAQMCNSISDAQLYQR
jgi:hypothetical protein